MMKRNYSIGVAWVVLFFFAFACDDLFEESIEDEVVKVVTPADGTISKNYTQTFWWENLKGALNYRLQIVYNKFDSAAEFKLDTLLSDSRFTVTLKPSSYQWRVVALNGSSETKENTIQNLRIDSASIAGQDLLLSAPKNNLISNESDIDFTWEELPGATRYRLQLFADGNNVAILDSLVKGATEFAYVLEDDAAYSWQVTGERRGVFSNPSEQWHYILDRESPDSVKLTSPGSSARVTSPVTLSWEASTDTRFLRYELYVYKGNASTPLSDKYNPYSTTKNSFSLTEGALNDKIFWKVRVVDKAGNKTSAEKTRTFTIQ
jgi:hypothetical protein